MVASLFTNTSRSSLRTATRGTRPFAMHAPNSSPATRTANLGVQAALATVLVVSSSYLYAHPASTPFDHAPRSGMMHCPARSFRAVASSSSPTSPSSPSVSAPSLPVNSISSKVASSAVFRDSNEWELRTVGVIGTLLGL